MRTFIIVVAAVMGLSAGASLAEATLLVPFWQESGPNAFYDWYAQNQARLVKFYSPLQILSAVGAVLGFLWLHLRQARGRSAMLLALLAAVAVLLLFPVYFKDANAAFVDRALAADQLSAALEVWGRWHWARVCLAGIAFFGALLSIPDR